MKRTRNVLLAALLLVSLLAPAARADVIVEPRDNFAAAHQDECQYLPRAYTANGAEGYTALWASPLSNRQVANLANGTNLYCYYLYADDAGETWALWEGDDIGWVHLSDCLVVPDYLTFQETCGDAFTDYDPAYDNAFDALDTVVLWKYPGSGEIVEEHVDAQWFRQNVSPAEAFTQCYLDPQGNFWGFSNYCYGIRNAWVCLSAPTAIQLPGADPVSREEPVPPAAVIPAPNAGIPWLAVGLVAAVVLVTAVLIPVVCRRKRT